MKKQCSTPKCRRVATLQLLGVHPICRKCGDEKNRKARARSAQRRAEGHYSPAIRLRWSEAKRKRMELANALNKISGDLIHAGLGRETYGDLAGRLLCANIGDDRHRRREAP